MSSAPLRARVPLQTRLGQAAVAVSVPLVLLAANVQLAASPLAIGLEYRRAGFPAPVGMTARERERLSQSAAEFVVGRARLSELSGLAAGSRPLLGPAEIEHLVDVRRLVALVSVAALLGLVAIVVAWARWRREYDRRFYRALEWGGLATVALVVLVGTMVLVAWRTFFIGFHQVFFDPGTWQFDQSSGLIRLYPERFWFDTALFLALVSLAQGVAVAVAGHLGARVGREPVARAAA